MDTTGYKNNYMEYIDDQGGRVTPIEPVLPPKTGVKMLVKQSKQVVKINLRSNDA